MFHFGEKVIPSGRLSGLSCSAKGMGRIVVPFVLELKKLAWYWDIDGSKEPSVNNMEVCRRLKISALDCHVKMEIIRVLIERRNAIVFKEEYVTPIWWG
jgi:hypothetical protein